MDGTQKSLNGDNLVDGQGLREPTIYETALRD